MSGEWVFSLRLHFKEILTVILELHSSSKLLRDSLKILRML